MSDMERTNNESVVQGGSAGPAKLGIFAAIGAALVGSICCLGPLVLVSLGAGGAWIGSLSALEAYRPFFMALSVVSLGLAFSRVYRSEESHCEDGQVCARPTTKRVTKVSLWLSVLLVFGLFASPYVIGRLAAGSAGAQVGASQAAQAKAAAATTQTVTLGVEGMTCVSCPATVKKSLTRLDGVVDAEVSFDPPRAVVEFNSAKLSSNDLVEATAAVGYPSHVLP